MKKKLKEIPKFKTEDEEREFWSTHDSTDYFDWDKAECVVFPKLKPTTRTISLRLPQSMLDRLRAAANKRDVPYQSFIKMILQDRLDQEFKASK
ncbi:MAG: BrnA antitoxin family protein [Chloracidobacterium sp.]|nr:BrnA antitoxin family protein [Chloracidobacterium sp.]